jgi:hypothetical protein
MANVKISQLASAATLTGTEEVAIVQSNVTVRTTAQNIANLASGGGGLAFPTVSITPAIPSYTPQQYFVPPVFDIGGVKTDSTKYGYSFNSLVTGATGIYYGNNKITALSTTATVIDTLPVFNFDPTFTILSLPTVEVVIQSNNSFLSILNIPPFSSLTSVSFANLKLLGTLTLSGNLLNTINFPLLEYLESSLGIFTIASNTPISFPLLQNIGQSLDISGFSGDSVSFPNLVFIGNNIGISLGSGANPQTLNLNSLQTIFGTGVTIQMSNLTSFTLPSLKSVAPNSNIYFYTTLNEASVDSLLISFAALDGTNGTTLWNTGILSIAAANAAPSATGIAARDILIGRGVQVTTN